MTYPSSFSCCVVVGSKLYFGFISVTMIMSALLSHASSCNSIILFVSVSAFVYSIFISFMVLCSSLLFVSPSHSVFVSSTSDIVEALASV